MNRLLTRMVLFFSCLIIAASAILGFTIYRSSMELIENALGAQAQLVAERAVRLIEPAEYAGLVAEEMETPYYHQLRGQLNELRESNGLRYLYTLAAANENGNTSYYYVVDGAPPEVDEEDFSPIGTEETNEYPGMIRAFAEGTPIIGELTSDDDYGATLTAYVPIVDAGGRQLGVMGADFDASEIYALMERNKRTAWLIAGVVIVSGILLIVLLANYLTRPLNQLTIHVAKVKEGDMTVQIPVSRKDEIGHLAATFQQLVAGTGSAIRSMRSSSEQLLRSSGAMSHHARSTSDASHFIAGSIQDAAVGAQIQVDRIADMTKAVESMSHGMSRITDSTALVSDIAQSTRSAGAEGSDKIAEAIREMEHIRSSTEEMAANTRELESRSDEIGSITSIMAGIAAQTNLLALNAAIEAAHAGEEGRGFAVVAEQVRKLANQSQVFADQIGGLIAETQEQTARLSAGMDSSASKAAAGLALVQEAGIAFQSIVSGIEQVDEQLREVFAASRAISSEAEEISASVEEMEQISRNAAQLFDNISQHSRTQLDAMDEVAASADALRAMSSELAELNNRFKV